MSDIRAVKKYAAQHDLFNRLHSISADESFVKDVAENWFDGRFEVVQISFCPNFPLWAETLEKSSLPLPNLAKPLRPFFIHPSTSTPPAIPLNPPYTPIICLSASRWVNNPDDQIPSVTRLGDTNRTVGFDYIPGAGDDDELWARGLTPTLFHSNRSDLLKAERDNLPSLVDELVLSHSMSKLPAPSASSLDSNSLSSIGESTIGIPDESLIIALSIGSPIITTSTQWKYSTSSDNTIIVRVVEYERYPKDLPRLLDFTPEERILAVANSKTEGKAYESTLSELVDFLRNQGEKRGVVLVHGRKEDVELALELYREAHVQPPEGKGQQEEKAKLDEPPEPSVEGRKLILPLALALICSMSPSNDEIQVVNEDTRLTKSDIAVKLHGLISLWPDGNPPRASLKRVNEFLMSGDRGRK
ncbi:hypothetical protein V865_001359 [Kwoniella europaea PYCC6329]|uniref:Uncharacterized protein n=1 Tax=Kwoniella europaea PYCC6329 TaxID=1423913 RepID=A0AAX4KCY1_9TREE